MAEVSGWDLLFHENMERPRLPNFSSSLRSRRRSSAAWTVWPPSSSRNRWISTRWLRRSTAASDRPRPPKRHEGVPAPSSVHLCRPARSASRQRAGGFGGSGLPCSCNMPTRLLMIALLSLGSASAAPAPMPSHAAIAAAFRAIDTTKWGAEDSDGAGWGAAEL